MQNPFKSISFKKLTLLFCSLIALSFTACKDDDDDTTVEPQPISFVSFYHGLPTSEEFDILLGNQRLNSQGFRYTNYSNYLNFSPGSSRIRFTRVNAVNAVIDTTMNLEEDKAYSLFITGQDQNIKLLAVRDSIHTIASGKSVVRIVNLSPDASAVDVSTAGTNSTALTTNLGFRGITEFKELSSGSQTLQIKRTDNGENLLPASDINLASGKAYTLIIRGFVTPPSGNTNTLNAQLIPNY